MAAGRLGVDELVEGLTRHPGVSHGVATKLAEYGPEARAALPALHRALEALEPPEGNSPFDHSTALERRGHIIEAIRKLAPEQPSPLFSRRDVQILLDPLSPRSTPGLSEPRMEALQRSLTPALLDWLKPGEKLLPDHLRQFLAAVGEVEPHFRDALLTATRKVDPDFAVPEDHAMPSKPQRAH